MRAVATAGTEVRVEVIDRLELSQGEMTLMAHRKESGVQCQVRSVRLSLCIISPEITLKVGGKLFRNACSVGILFINSYPTSMIDTTVCRRSSVLAWSLMHRQK